MTTLKSFSKSSFEISYSDPPLNPFLMVSPPKLEFSMNHTKCPSYIWYPWIRSSLDVPSFRIPIVRDSDHPDSISLPNSPASSRKIGLSYLTPPTSRKMGSCRSPTQSSLTQVQIVMLKIMQFSSGKYQSFNEDSLKIFGLCKESIISQGPVSIIHKIRPGSQINLLAAN